jgi:hypothetical protein
VVFCNRWLEHSGWDGPQPATAVAERNGLAPCRFPVNMGRRILTAGEDSRLAGRLRPEYVSTGRYYLAMKVNRMALRMIAESTGPESHAQKDVLQEDCGYSPSGHSRLTFFCSTWTKPADDCSAIKC